MNRYSFSSSNIHFSPSILGEASYKIRALDFVRGSEEIKDRIRTRINAQKEYMGASSTLETVEPDQSNLVLWWRVVYLGPKYNQCCQTSITDIRIDKTSQVI